MRPHMALSDAKKNYPSMDIEPYNDMIDGMLMDPQPGLPINHHIDRSKIDMGFPTWDELYFFLTPIASRISLQRWIMC